MKRYELIDTLRGLAVISMILYHACWIMNHFGFVIPSDTLYGPIFTVWERSICMGFITIAGFSFSLGRHHFRSGIKIFGCGLAITLVTCLLVPEIRIVFGVLTLIGTATLLTIPVDRMIGQGSRKTLIIVFLLSLLVFLFTYHINKGYLGSSRFPVYLPGQLYQGLFATFLGFTEYGFFSTDYFSVIPWFFLYLCGYCLHKIIKGTGAENVLEDHYIPGINIIGRHSLIIYILHPIVIYGVLYIIALRAH